MSGPCLPRSVAAGCAPARVRSTFVNLRFEPLPVELNLPGLRKDGRVRYPARSGAVVAPGPVERSKRRTHDRGGQHEAGRDQVGSAHVGPHHRLRDGAARRAPSRPSGREGAVARPARDARAPQPPRFSITAHPVDSTAPGCEGRPVHRPRREGAAETADRRQLHLGPGAPSLRRGRRVAERVQRARGRHSPPRPSWRPPATSPGAGASASSGRARGCAIPWPARHSPRNSALTNSRCAACSPCMSSTG